MPQDKEMMDFIGQLSNHIDKQFESTNLLLQDIKKSTEENTKNIIELKADYKNIEKDFEDWKLKENDQHKEFFSRITKAELKSERLTTIVWLVGVAVPVVVTIIGIALNVFMR